MTLFLVYIVNTQICDECDTIVTLIKDVLSLSLSYLKYSVHVIKFDLIFLTDKILSVNEY